MRGSRELVAAVRTAKQFLTYVASGPFPYAVAEALALPDPYYAAFRDGLQTATAQSLRAGYASLDLGLADAVNVALAADYDTDAVLTLDRRDFRAVRPLGRHKCFRLLPDDLPL